MTETAGYDEDVMFLVVPNSEFSDASEFSRCIPLVLDMCTLCRIVNVTKESKLDRLSSPWSTARTWRLLSRWGMADLDSGEGGDTEEGAAAPEEPQDKGIDEPVKMRESVRLGPFQMQMLQCKTMLLLGETAHVMVAPLKAGMVQPTGMHPYLWAFMCCTHTQGSGWEAIRCLSLCMSCNVRQSHLSEEGCAGSPHCVSLTSTPSQTLIGDGSHSGGRGVARAHVSGYASEEAPREAEPRWSQQLDSPECSSHERACTGLKFVCAFCGLVGHYRCFIKGFAHITRLLHDVLRKEVKMGPVQLPLEAWEVVRILKDKIQPMPMLVFPDFDKPFLLDTDASKEGLGVVLSQKQDDGCYHPVAVGSHSLTPSEKNYHSSKLEFLTLKWSVT